MSIPSVHVIIPEGFRLATEVIKDFIAIDPETQPRNVTAWTPVVTDILKGTCEFEETAVCPLPA